LRAWRERFLASLPQVEALGFDARFQRLWEFYLAYCEGGFLERSIGISHLLLAKPGATRRAERDWKPAPERAA
jgi:cyclopropane-fatty-acyl-phospholipid synthase